MYQYITQGPPRIVSAQIVLKNWPSYRAVNPAISFGPDGNLHILACRYTERLILQPPCPSASEESELWYLKVQPITGSVLTERTLHVPVVPPGADPAYMEHVIWPHIICAGTSEQTEIYVTWSQHENLGVPVPDWTDDHDIFFQRSLDGGSTWLANAVMITSQTDTTFDEVQPQLLLDSFTDTLICVYQKESKSGAYSDEEILNDNPKDIFCQTSTNLGINWSAPFPVTFSNQASFGFISPMIQQDSSGNVYISALKKWSAASSANEIHIFRYYPGSNQPWRSVFYNPVANDAAHDGPTRTPYRNPDISCSYPSFKVTGVNTFTIMYEKCTDGDNIPEAISYAKRESGVTTTDVVWTDPARSCRAIVHFDLTASSVLQPFWAVDDGAGPDIMYGEFQY